MRPSSAPIMTDGRTALGRNFVIACWGRNSSRTPATSAPRTMKGIASQRTLLNVRMKSEILGSTWAPSSEARTSVLRPAWLASSGAGVGSGALSGPVVLRTSVVVDVAARVEGEGGEAEDGGELVPH